MGFVENLTKHVNQFMLTSLGIVFLMLGQFTLGDHSHESGMCITDPNVSSVSCTHHLWNRPTETQNKRNCTLLLSPNAPSKGLDCAAWTFDHGSGIPSDSLGSVSLKPYFYKFESFYQTAFNVVISNIKWTDFKMRFRRVENATSNFCRHFKISANEPVSADSVLFYDCLWSYGQYEGVDYIFEYMASFDGSYPAVGQYLFLVPSHEVINPKRRYLNETTVYSFMDLSDWPILKLRLQLPQDDFFDANVFSIQRFIVSLHYGRINSSLESIQLSPQSSMTDSQELIYEYETRYEGGYYYFTVQIDHVNCSLYAGGCAVLKTPVYHAPEDIHLRMLIGIVGCGGALLSIFVFVYFVWRWSQKYKAGGLPTVLVSYAPTTTTHMQCVEEFVKVLRNACYINALLDIMEIPKTSTQDPFVWCNDAFEKADFIMILSSPYQQCDGNEGIYRNVDALILQHLKEELSDRKSKKQIFSVIFPYCTEKDLPNEAKNLKQFFVPKDFVKMLNCLHSNTYQGELELEEDGAAFLQLLSKAEAEVVSKKCICVNREGHKLSLDDLDTIDLTPSKDSSEDLLLPQREKTSSDVLTMYPGPIENLDLLGSEGEQSSDAKNKTQTTKKLVVDLNDLNLG